MILNVVRAPGSIRRSIFRVRLACSIRELAILPLRSTTKMNSWAGIGGKSNLGTTVNCIAIVSGPRMSRSAKHRGASSPSAWTVRTKSLWRKVVERNLTVVRRCDFLPRCVLYGTRGSIGWVGLLTLRIRPLIWISVVIRKRVRLEADVAFSMLAGGAP